MHEDIPILDFHVPKAFSHENGRLTGVVFEKVAAQYDEKGRRNLVPTGEPDVHIACDDVLVAVGQENAFPWIEKDIATPSTNGASPSSTRGRFKPPLPTSSSAAVPHFAPKTASCPRRLGPHRLSRSIN